MKKILYVGILLTFFLYACGQKDVSKMSAIDFQKKLEKLQNINYSVEKERSELFGLIREYNETRPDPTKFDIASFDTLIGAPEKELLRQMFAEEKDISHNGMLKTIIEKNNNLAELQERIAALQRKLPAPYTVTSGDTHFKVALDYLTKEHDLTASEAFHVAWKTSLVDELLPGNLIWLAYNDGLLVSYVTQGTAPIPPMTVHVLAKQKLIDAAKGAQVNKQSS